MFIPDRFCGAAKDVIHQVTDWRRVSHYLPVQQANFNRNPVLEIMFNLRS